MTTFIQPIEIDGVKEDLSFEHGGDYSSFIHYKYDVQSMISTAKNYVDFIAKAKRILRVKIHDDRFDKWRLSYIQRIEKDYLKEKERKKGFKSVEPKVIKDSMKGVLDQLKEYSKNEAIVLKLTEMVRDDYFDRGSIKVKGFFTFFSIELLGPDKKTSLYNAYRDLLKEGRPKLLE